MLYVANLESNDVSVIDIVANTVVATVPVGEQPGGMAVSPDGAWLYVANAVSSSVSSKLVAIQWSPL
jgi:YVTN family beta-propeller protein